MQIIIPNYILMKSFSHNLLHLLLLLVFTSTILCSRPLNTGWSLSVNSGVFPARPLPTTVIDDLIFNKILPSDFYYRDNFLRAYEYQTKDASYSSSFFISQQQQNSKYKELIFEGLDTHCQVFLNNKKILESHNMHRRYEIDVELQRLNNLTIKFYSAANYDLQQEKIFQDKYGFKLPQNYSYSRKSAYHYGWDWGPRIVSSGIWKQIYLNCYNQTKIRTLQLNQLTQINASTTYLKNEVKVYIDRLAPQTKYLIEILAYSTQTKTQVYNFTTSIHLQQQLNLTVPWIIAENFSQYIWWTWQLGQQPLFYLKLTVTNTMTLTYSSKTVNNIGFRTIKLKQTPDQWGKSFIFNLNGIDIYCRGGNYIPPEMSLAKTTPETYQIVIKNARAQNFNMIRVWGGGQFEKDQFYEECDKNGILIWHDLMFACALYPFEYSIGDDIQQEMRDNLIRLRHHPSLALWNGNNEVWIGWLEWGWKNNKTEQQKQLIESMYKSIFQGILPKVIQQVTPTIPYWETSPSVSSNSLDNMTQGDVHFWRVWGAGTPIQEYNAYIGRFNSQYGMQSMPDIETIQNFTLPQDRQLGSMILRLHQRHPKGDQYLPQYVKNNTYPSQNLTRYTYFSQVMQSYALQLAITTLRGNKPYNMGSLYWQLNDVWPVASWATVDYLQNKKAAHYKIKDLYEPLMLASYRPSGDYEWLNVAYAVNDYNKEFTCKFSAKIMNFSGTVMQETSLQKVIGPNSRVELDFEFGLMGIRENLRENVESNRMNNGYRLEADSGLIDDMYSDHFSIISMTCQPDNIVRQYHYFYVKPSQRSILNPQLTYQYYPSNNSVSIRTRNLATYIWVYSQVNGKHYSFKSIEQNYFNMLPGEMRSVRLGQVPKGAQQGIKVTCYQIEVLSQLKQRKEKEFSEGNVRAEEDVFESDI